nr:hypothetical protein [Acinetobacter gyllenbergii]ESK34661.1 hypothetical protein F987_04442 [Acinetobacter gyllenbergii NIPH 230]
MVYVALQVLLCPDIINTGITTVGGAISSVLPGVHPVTDLTNLGTLTFETSRDTVNGTLEAISDLAGADIGGAAGSRLVLSAH